MNRFRRKSHQKSFHRKMQSCFRLDLTFRVAATNFARWGRRKRVEFPSGKQISKTYLPQNRVLLLMCVAAQGFGKNGAVCILRGLRVFLGYIILGNGRDK